MNSIQVNRFETHLKMSQTQLFLLVFLIVLIILPAGCQNSAAYESSTTTASQTTTSGTSATVNNETTATASSITETTALSTTTTTTADPNEPRNLLTGELLEEGETGRERPIAVMINNIKVATPQIGISAADLLFETQVEGGITRLMAVFSNVADIPELGSIRSARHDYIDMAGGLDAVLVHVGASYLANDQFSAQKSPHIDLHVYSSAYWRDEEWKENRGYEHSVKSNGERLQAALIKSKYRTEVRENQNEAFHFRSADDFIPADGPTALHVTAPFSSYCVATFSYDEASGLYIKGQFGKPQIDLANGSPIRFTNVFLLQTKIIIAESVLKDVDLRKGKGFYLSGGQYQDITWEKGGTEDPFVFYAENGAELSVNTGKSYIGIISNQRTITFEP